MQKTNNDVPTTRRQDIAGEIGAGAALGLLVGILLGLSVAEVVGSIIGGLAAMLATFFGLGKSSAESNQNTLHTWRIASFGFVCSIGVLLGVATRAHDWLGEPIDAQVERWKVAGASSEEAIVYVAYQRLGIVPLGRTANAPPKATSGATVLFANHDVSECANLSKQRFANEQKRLDAMHNIGGNWATFAKAAASMPANQLDAMLDAGYQLVCGD